MKPVINSVPAFDCTVGGAGTFTNKSYTWGYKITIKNNSGNSTIYEGNLVTSAAKEFVIPANIEGLQNNKNYLLYLTTYEGTVGNTGVSYTSDPKIIKCRTTPSFMLYIDNQSSSMVIQSTIFMHINYTEVPYEYEYLNNFYISFTDNSTEQEVFKTKTYYNQNEEIEVNDLDNEKEYTIVAYGTTVNGMKIQTSPIVITTNFISNSAIGLTAENIFNKGYIELKGDFGNIILYRFNNNNFTYGSNGLFDYIKLDENWLQYYKPDEEIFLTGDYKLVVNNYVHPKKKNNLVLLLNSENNINSGNGDIKLICKLKSETDNETDYYTPFFEFHVGSHIFIINNANTEGAFENMRIAKANYNQVSFVFNITIQRINGEYSFIIDGDLL